MTPKNQTPGAQSRAPTGVALCPQLQGVHGRPGVRAALLAAGGSRPGSHAVGSPAGRLQVLRGHAGQGEEPGGEPPAFDSGRNANTRGWRSWDTSPASPSGRRSEAVPCGLCQPLVGQGSAGGFVFLPRPAPPCAGAGVVLFRRQRCGLGWKSWWCWVASGEKGGVDVRGLSTLGACRRGAVTCSGWQWVCSSRCPTWALSSGFCSAPAPLVAWQRRCCSARCRGRA